jgi:hypothetical protein
MKASIDCRAGVSVEGWTLTALICCCGFAVCQGAEFYVSTAGDDAQAGTSPETAWRHVAHAAKTAKAGDTVKIKGGTYESEHVVVAESGTEKAPIVFEGCDGTPVLDGGADRKGIGILIGGREYVVLRNLKIVNYHVGVRIQSSKRIISEKLVIEDMGVGKYMDGSAGFSVSAASEHCTFSNCSMKNCNTHCLNFMAESNNNVVDSCTFYITTGEKLSADYAIYTENAHHNTIKNCTIKNLHPLEKGHHGHGIALRLASHHNKVIDCEASGLLEAFVVGEDGYENEFVNCVAYDLEGAWKIKPNGHSDALVARFGAHDNRFIDCKSIGCSQGICLWTMDPNPNAKMITENVARRNVFRNCIVAGAQQSAVILTRAEENRIENCTIVDSKMLYNMDGAKNNVLKNCIVTGIGALSYGKGDVPAATYGCFWKNGFEMPAGEGNVAKEPLFADAGNRDYRLKSAAGRLDPKKKEFVNDEETSPCIDGGDPKSEFDKEPAPNGGRIDMGAYGNTPEASKSAVQK